MFHARMIRIPKSINEPYLGTITSQHRQAGTAHLSSPDDYDSYAQVFTKEVIVEQALGKMHWYESVNDEVPLPPQSRLSERKKLKLIAKKTHHRRKGK